MTTTGPRENGMSTTLDGLLKGEFTLGLGLRGEGAGAGWAAIGLDIDDRHMNRNGIAHGGVIATLLDSASGLACIFDDNGAVMRTVVTVSLTTNFLRPVTSGRLTATARVRAGRRTFTVDCDCVDADGVLVATSMGVFQTVRSP